MPENPKKLDKLAKKNKCTAVVDFGFAPGLCHVVVGRYYKKYGTEMDVLIEVGGNPQEGDYKAPFSPIDVIEEYTRPVRYLDNGKIKIIENPLEELDPCTFSFEYMGFPSDGLRSLLDLKIEYLKEFTLRHPDHLDDMQLLDSYGFFKKEHLKNTAKVLIDKWKITKQDKDKSEMQISIDTLYHDHKVYFYDEFSNNNFSMQRITGYPAIWMVEQILNGYENHGVIFPEYIGMDEKLYKGLMSYLKKKKITIEEE